jgi:hypothetical protein
VVARRRWFRSRRGMGGQRRSGREKGGRSTLSPDARSNQSQAARRSAYSKTTLNRYEDGLQSDNTSIM